jgi:hypothetical protein
MLLGTGHVDAFARGHAPEELIDVKPPGVTVRGQVRASSGGSCAAMSRASPADKCSASVSSVALVAASARSREIPACCWTMVRN